MLQQTTVAAVIPYFERWLRVFPDLRSLAKAPLRRVLKEWQGLGYYQRARNLLMAARAIVREHGGRVPRDPAVLRRLPGFGPYTAAAVASLAYGEPVPVLEANARRVLMRFLGIRKPAGGAVDRLLMEFLRRVFAKDRPADFNQAIMELGALVCRNRHPRCLACPVKRTCRAFAEGLQDLIPPVRARRLEKVEAVVALIKRSDGRLLIQKRPDKGLFGGMWEFPGGKIEPGETPRKALDREVREELGTGLGKAVSLGVIRHSYTRFDVTLHVFEGRLRGEPALLGRQRRWASLEGIQRYPLPSASARIVELLARTKGSRRKRPRFSAASSGP